MRRDPDAAEELLLDLKADAQDPVTDTLSLVHGLRPQVPVDLDLLCALRESAAHYSAKGLAASEEASSAPPSRGA